MSTLDKNRLFWLLTYPRTGSHLLCRILNKDEQPGFLEGKTEYYFFEAMFARVNTSLYTKNIDTWTEEERQTVKMIFQNCFDNLQSSVARAREEGKSLFVKEHSSFMVQPPVNSRHLFGDENVKEPAWQVQFDSGVGMNYTPQSINTSMIPESFLSFWHPTFLIRHPALALESQYRAKIRLDGIMHGKSDPPKMPLEKTVRWSRNMYNWYLEYFKREKPTNTLWPIVLDADDVMTNPELVRHYAKLIGMDPTKLKFTWAPGTLQVPGGLREKLFSQMTTTINSSAGIVEGKTWAGSDLDTKVSQWKEEFGEEEGMKLEKLVRDAIPDYEFMLSRKLTL